MKKNCKLILATMVLALVAGTAEARKPVKGGGGGGTPTNYGCSTLAAGTKVTSADGLTTKSLLMATSACYLCNMTTMICVLQSPSTLYGWTFHY